jgi:hypothetical protein
MKTLHTLLTAASLAIYTTGALAQTDSTTKKEIETGAFTGIIAGGTFNIVLNEALTTKVQVETTSANQDNISAKVNSENALVISSNGKANAKTTLRIYAPTINYIKLSGSADLSTNGDLIENELRIVMSGAAEANLAIVANDLETEVSGAAELKIKGVTNNHTSQISGAGELKAINLLTTNTTAKMSGAGHAQVNAKNELNAKISGASSISFKEEPAIKNIDVSGAGSVTKKEEDTEIAKAEMNANGGSDTTRFNFKNKKIMIIEGNDSAASKTKKPKNNTWHHWSGVEFGFNGLLNSANKTNLGEPYNYLQNPGKSYHVAVNFYEKGFNLYKHKINLVTGLGLEFANYSIKNNITLATTGGLPAQVFQTSGIAPMIIIDDMPKNKLRANYLTIPLMLDLNTSKKEKNNWHLSAGVIGAWRYGSFTKQIINTNGSDIKTKIKDDYSLNDFKVSATLRAGYRGLNVFANYGLTPLFTKNNNPDLYPVTVGVSLGIF